MFTLVSVFFCPKEAFSTCGKQVLLDWDFCIFFCGNKSCEPSLLQSGLQCSVSRQTLLLILKLLLSWPLRLLQWLVCWCLLVLAGSPSSTANVLSCKVSQLQRSEPTASRIGVASCLLGTIAKSWTWIEILSSLIYRGCLSQYQTVVQPKSGDLQKSESDIPRKACQWARSLLQSMSPQTAIWASKGLDRLLLEEPPGVIKASQNHPYHLLRYFSCRCVFLSCASQKWFTTTRGGVGMDRKPVLSGHLTSKNWNRWLYRVVDCQGAN